MLGCAYLENSDDTHNTPSRTLVNQLEELDAEVGIHDPYVAHYRTDLAECVRGCNAVVVMVKHDVYQAIELIQSSEWIGSFGAKPRERRAVPVNGWRVFDRSEAQPAGFVFRGVGIGQ